MRDAIVEKGDIYVRHEKVDEAIKTYEEAFSKSVGINKKMDCLFYVLKLLIQRKDIEKTKQYLDRQKYLLD